MEKFLTLPKTEQQNLLSRSGEVLINFKKGPVTVWFYRMNSYFVKVTKKEGVESIETLPSLDGVKLYD